MSARLFCLSFVIVLASPAAAADRSVGVGSFDRVRIDGAFVVRMTTGRPPRASIAGDPRAIDQVELRVDGTTLHVRRRSDGAAAARLAAGSTVVVTLSAPTLLSAAMQGAGDLTIAGMRADRIDLSVAGAGTIVANGIDAQQANALLVGTGAITLAGHAAHVRLSTNGPGSIDADALLADDLIVRLDGPGETKAHARYLAQVVSTGSGRVTVAGQPKCTVRSPAGGAVSCGDAAR